MEAVGYRSFGSVVWESRWFLIQGYRTMFVMYADGRKRTILEHREVKAKAIGRNLTRKEYVHHVDGNKLNNEPSNLELMTPGDHARMHYEARGIVRELYRGVCPECGKEFTKFANNVRHNQGKLKKAGPFCGKSCAGRYGQRLQKNVRKPRAK